jgi:hypothetical protein
MKFQESWTLVKKGNNSMEITHLTFDEHQNLISELTKLQLHFLWNWLKKYPGEEFSKALRDRIDLCRKTDSSPKGFDIAEVNFETMQWKKLETALLQIYQNHRHDENADQFESAAFQIIFPLLDQFAQKTYGKSTKFDSYQCGSLKYDKPDDKYPGTVFFHIANAVAPKSIFSEPEYLSSCLQELMNQSEKEYAADSLRTETWLNSLPKWLEYFPEEWKHNMKKESKNVQWHFGFWGQFISAKGTFNAKYAQRLRDCGDFPFWPRESRCSFIDLRKHLKEMP